MPIYIGKDNAIISGVEPKAGFDQGASVFPAILYGKCGKDNAVKTFYTYLDYMDWVGITFYKFAFKNNVSDATTWQTSEKILKANGGSISASWSEQYSTQLITASLANSSSYGYLYLQFKAAIVTDKSSSGIYIDLPYTRDSKPVSLTARSYNGGTWIVPYSHGGEIVYYSEQTFNMGDSDYGSGHFGYIKLSRGQTAKISFSDTKVNGQSLSTSIGVSFDD